jgi:hypothetical protein
VDSKESGLIPAVLKVLTPVNYIYCSFIYTPHRREYGLVFGVLEVLSPGHVELETPHSKESSLVPAVFELLTPEHFL